MSNTKKILFKTYASKIWAEGDKVTKIYHSSLTSDVTPISRLKSEDPPCFNFDS